MNQLTQLRFFLALLTSGVAMYTDITKREISNKIVLTLVVYWVMFVFMGSPTLTYFLNSIKIALLYAVVSTLVYLKEQFGAGDVKFLTALGLMIGGTGIGITYLINVFFWGVFWMIGWMFYLTTKHRAVIKKEFERTMFDKAPIIRKANYTLFAITMILNVILFGNFEANLSFYVIGAFLPIIASLCLYATWGYGRAVHKTAVKDAGIPFAPAFFIALLFTIWGLF